MAERAITAWAAACTRHQGGASLIGDTFSKDIAQGGTGGQGYSAQGTSSSTGGVGGHGGNGLGGGLYATAGTIIIKDETFSDDAAQGGTGGAGGRTGGGENSVNGGGQGGNGSGGAIDNSGSSLTLLNDTISGNTAAGANGGSGGYGYNAGPGNGGAGGSGTGGGVLLAGSSTTTLTNTLIAENSKTAGTGGIGGGYNSGGHGSPGSPGSASDPDVAGNVHSSDHDLIGDGTGSNLSNGDTGGDLVGYSAAQLNLGSLGSNGGPTQTIALLPGSPAIGAGDPSASGLPTTDQRGYARTTNGKVDIGAVESQYDLALSGSVAVGSTAGTVQYSYLVTNNGPDAAGSTTLTVPLPQGIAFESLTLPSGWTPTNPGAGNSGSVIFTDTANLSSGQSASFTITGQLQNTSAGAILSSTATLAPTASDTNLQNNSLSLTVANEQEGQAFQQQSGLAFLSNVKLFQFTDTPTLSNVTLCHFTDPTTPNAAASSFTATVTWGDNDSNKSSDGSGTVSVVADPAGGFDVIGSHTYATAGTYNLTVAVSGTDGTNDSHQETETFPTPTASSFTATVNWGDGQSNTSSDGSGTVSVVADPTGGFDVYGSHTYATGGTYNVSVAVTGTDGTTDSEQETEVFQNTVELYHFTDSNASATAKDFTATVNWGDGWPLLSNAQLIQFTDTTTPSATASSFTATVNWGDGQSNTSSDGSGTVSVVPVAGGSFDVYGSHSYAALGTYTVSVTVTGTDHTSYSQQNTEAFPNTVSVVADPSGGFDVLGSHTYAETGNYAASVSITGLDGTQISANSAALFVVADAPLTAGSLTPPSNPATGQAISNVKLFHFTDANPAATAADYTALISWGDGNTSTVTSTTSSSVGYVVADPAGGFDVYGSHTYTTGFSNGTFSVQVNDVDGASTQANADYEVDAADQQLTAGTLYVPSVTTEGQSISSQLLFQFTDPDTYAQAGDYLATVQWGDGNYNSSNDGSNSVWVAATSTPGLWDVYGSHVYGSGSAYFSVKVTDEGDPRSPTPDAGGDFTAATSNAKLTLIVPAVVLTAGGTFSATEGNTSSVQTVATFTDPAGTGSGSAGYVATITWGDGTSSTATLTGQGNYSGSTPSGTNFVSSSSNPGIVLNGQTYSIDLAHQYATEGTYQISVSVYHNGVTSQTVTTTASVGDYGTLTGTPGSSITGTYGGTITNATLATFTDTYTADPATNFTATINWGDGHSTSGMVSGSNGSYTVTGSHTYSAATTYSIAVTLTEDGGGTVTNTVDTSAAISPAQLIITASNQSKFYGQTLNLGTSAFTYSGLVTGDSVTSVTLFSTGAAAGATVAGSPYNIVPSNAVGSGLSNYTISYDPGSLTVNKAATTLSVSSTANPFVAGQSLTFTATVSVTSPGSGNPTGSVNFYSNGTLLNSTPATLQTNNGVTTATYATSAFTQTGTYTITATYGGDSNFQGSPTGTLMQQIIPDAPASISIVAGNNQSASLATLFNTALRVVVKDAFGNVLSGIVVTFTVQLGSTGASGAFNGSATATATTTSGVATAPTLKAGGKIGSFSIIASVAGLSEEATFSETVTGRGSPVF